MSVEVINGLFEGLISVVGLVGAFVVMVVYPAATAEATSIATAIVVFWFGGRNQVKAVNGNIAALASIANQMQATSAQTVKATAETIATTQGSGGH